MMQCRIISSLTQGRIAVCVYLVDDSLMMMSGHDPPEAFSCWLFCPTETNNHTRSDSQRSHWLLSESELLSVGCAGNLHKLWAFFKENLCLMSAQVQFFHCCLILHHKKKKIFKWSMEFEHFKGSMILL